MVLAVEKVEACFICRILWSNDDGSSGVTVKKTQNKVSCHTNNFRTDYR